VIGKWHLARDATFGGNARGSFTLLLRRTAAGWRIVMDHTESDATLATAARRERGIVKWFNASKGYGFIANTSGEDVFVHFSAINSSGYRILVDGDSVEYTPKRGPKGVQAEDIKVLPKGSNRPRSF
jgi:CspA family cold shock protein